jgi:Protein involved in polysaccharide intercellular adhesin (PIA) synthesis/biofilm formation
MIIIVLGWIALILTGLKIKDREIEEALGIWQCNVLKGICAVEILIGHIGFITEEPLLFFNRKAGVLFVGIFFFLSGYGLMYSKEHKPNYMRGLFIKKAISILGPAYVIYVLFQIIDWYLSGNIDYIYSIINPVRFFYANNWFVWEIILLYLLFSVIYRIRNIMLANGILVAISLMFIAVGFITKIENPWYGSTLCFSVGILFYQWRERISLFLKKYWFKSILTGTALVIVFTLAFFILGNESIIGNPVSRNLAAIFFCITTVTALCKIGIGNKATALLGDCSYEIYLIHPYVLAELRGRIAEPFLYAVAVIIITVLGAYLIKLAGKQLGKIRNAKHV